MSIARATFSNAQLNRFVDTLSLSLDRAQQFDIFLERKQSSIGKLIELNFVWKFSKVRTYITKLNFKNYNYRVDYSKSTTLTVCKMCLVSNYCFIEFLSFLLIYICFTRQIMIGRGHSILLFYEM